jgi:hypothetical protein
MCHLENLQFCSISVNLLSTSVHPMHDETWEAVFRFSKNLKWKKFTKNFQANSVIICHTNFNNHFTCKYTCFSMFLKHKSLCIYWAKKTLHTKVVCVSDSSEYMLSCSVQLIWHMMQLEAFSFSRPFFFFFKFNRTVKPLKFSFTSET